jgi:DHA1 family inner membrane transport protein
LGGLAIAGGLGWASTGWVGALLALGGLIIFVVSLAEERRNARERVRSGQIAPMSST